MWYRKLLELGIPQDLAVRMSPSLQTLPYDPNQFSTIQQLVPVMESHGFQSLDWWEDLQAIIAQIMQMLPGMAILGVGAAMAYFLRNVKIKGIPLALIGLIPMGIGTWMVVEPYLPQPGV